MKTVTVLGNVCIVPKGSYNPSTAYERLNLVTYKGSSFLCLRNVCGIVPFDDGINYQLVSSVGEKGADGVMGKDGKDGRDGVDGTNGVDGKDGSVSFATFEINNNMNLEMNYDETLQNVNFALNEKGNLEVIING